MTSAMMTPAAVENVMIDGSFMYTLMLKYHQ